MAENARTRFGFRANFIPLSFPYSTVFHTLLKTSFRGKRQTEYRTVKAAFQLDYRLERSNNIILLSSWLLCSAVNSSAFVWACPILKGSEVAVHVTSVFGL